MPRFAQQVQTLVGEGAGSPVRARRGSDPTPGVLMIGVAVAVGIGVSAGLDGWAGIIASGVVLAVVVFVAMAMLRDQVALVPHGDDVAVVELSSFGRPRRLHGLLPGPVRAEESKNSVYLRVQLGEQEFWIGSRREANRIALAG